MKTYRQIVKDLSQVYSEGEAQALARWLCEECFGLTQTDILLDKDNDLSADSIAKSQEIVRRLLNHEPIQYILGSTTFYGRRFTAAPGTLIPRPETEELLHHLLGSVAAGSSSPCAAAGSSVAAGFPSPSVAAGFAGSILDIGTGTGCIALTLALELPDAQVTAWDISPEALAVARRNASLYPSASVTFEQADIFSPPADDRLWDIIVSNPPYVRRCEAAEMEHNVLDYEPHLALFVPDDDPLLFYRAIAKYASTHLREDGQLWLEINQYLSAETAHLIEEYGFGNVQVINDSYGNPRFLFQQNTLNP